MTLIRTKIYEMSVSRKQTVRNYKVLTGVPIFSLSTSPPPCSPLRRPKSFCRLKPHMSDEKKLNIINNTQATRFFTFPTAYRCSARGRIYPERSIQTRTNEAELTEMMVGKRSTSTSKEAEPKDPQSAHRNQSHKLLIRDGILF